MCEGDNCNCCDSICEIFECFQECFCSKSSSKPAASTSGGVPSPASAPAPPTSLCPSFSFLSSFRLCLTCLSPFRFSHQPDQLFSSRFRLSSRVILLLLVILLLRAIPLLRDILLLLVILHLDHQVLTQIKSLCFLLPLW